ncbi:hypothetical protein SAMN04488029_0838 [Reichenbachiella faecimaris]|uniref:DUF1579 domain-containing protein n=1 Tax=Reichenbachiella faecimaris TaxID=692418 RepID=A0A1W2G794_REIFA|nr:hypothetical protein [Reichenbachiella faecimaris]SMD32493.1 hypothetical protein SAMN04488029_0838 [Reichenbachiella faecimaris]
MKLTYSVLFILGLSFQVSLAQPANITSLEFKLGKWKWQTKGLLRPGDPKMYVGEGESNVFYINDSSAILDDHHILWEDGTDYKAITYRTFDQSNNKFMVVWAQANSNQTTKISGEWKNDQFVETENGKDNYGNWTNVLRIYDITDDSHKAQLIRTYASGYQLTLLEYEATRTND